METYRHNKGIEKWRKEDIKIQETIHQLEQMQNVDSVVGKTIGNDENIFWTEILKSSYTACIIIKQLNKLRQ